MALNPAPSRAPCAVHKRYSLNWARSVVSALYEKYPRATDTVLFQVGIRLEHLVKLLAAGRYEYPWFRETIKKANLRLSRGWNPLNIDVGYLQILASMAPLSVQMYLDKRIECVRLEKRGLKEAPTGPTGPVGGYLLTPEEESRRFHTVEAIDCGL